MRKYILLSIALLLVLGAFFFLSKPKTSSSPAPVATHKTFNLVVKNNRLISGPNTLTVHQGDSVDIRITADVDGEFHLHGYDKHINFKKNTPDDLNFNANISGRFPYELEDTKTEIGALEVLPK